MLVPSQSARLRNDPEDSVPAPGMGTLAGVPPGAIPQLTFVCPIIAKAQIATRRGPDVDISWVIDAPLALQFLAFEILIAYLCYVGWKNGAKLLKQLDPVIRVMRSMPPERIEKAAGYLNRQFSKWEKAERELEEQGL